MYFPCLLRATLSITVILGIGCSFGRAGGPGFIFGKNEPPSLGPGQPARAEGILHRVGRELGREFGFCCWSSYNSYGVGNVYSQGAWMFGSGRTFFGEPCLPGPPATLLPPPPSLLTPRSRLIVPNGNSMLAPLPNSQPDCGCR
jgi:hypothetical protein